MAYGYDALNRVVCAEEGAANFNDPCASAGRRLATIAYDAQSRRQSVSYANGSTALFGYSARGDIRCHAINLTGAAASACNGAGAEVAYDFTSNGVGQILSESLASTLSGEDLVWRPSFSANDNYASNGLNQYTSVTGTTLSYDGNGNLTNDGRGRTYVFDAENVLRTATVSGTGTTDYRYYADGTRAEKIAPGNLTSQFYYMGGLGYLDAGDTEFAANQEIAEYDGATLLRRYVRLPGSVDEAFLMIDQSLPAGDRERWAHPNRLGSTIVISDSAGAVVDTHTYAPFGQAGEGDGGFPFRFTGQKLDPETGLYYYKARYYDPELGRFLQTDPIGYADQMNLYAYVGNDPINATDPTGMCSASVVCWGFVIGAGTGVVSEGLEVAVGGQQASWGGFAGAALGGGTAGAMIAGCKGTCTALASGAGAGVDSMTRQFVDESIQSGSMIEGVMSVDMTEVGVEFAAGAAAGAAFKLPGVNRAGDWIARRVGLGGNGGVAHVADTQTTRMDLGQIQNISPGTALKIVGTGIVRGADDAAVNAASSSMAGRSAADLPEVSGRCALGASECPN